MVGYHQDPQSLLTVADTNKIALWIKHWIFIVTNCTPTIAGWMFSYESFKGQSCCT